MDHMTAKVSCFARAYHYKVNMEKGGAVFSDTVAEQLLGADYEEISKNMMQGIPFFLPGFTGTPEEGLRIIVDRQLSPAVLARSACCEELLGQEIRKGCQQYIVYASGYDTFSLRNGDSAVSVFEIDLPEMILDKKKRIREAGLKSEAVFVSCSLADSLFAEHLKESGFQKDKVSFGSLLGISFYLTKEEFRTLMGRIGELMKEGSMLFFDYPGAEESCEKTTNQMLARSAGEEMKAEYSGTEIEQLVKDCGFEVCDHWNGDGMTVRYFAEYNRLNPEHPLKVPDGTGYLCAVRR